MKLFGSVEKPLIKSKNELLRKKRSVSKQTKKALYYIGLCTCTSRVDTQANAVCSSSQRKLGSRQATGSMPLACVLRNLAHASYPSL